MPTHARPPLSRVIHAALFGALIGAPLLTMATGQAWANEQQQDIPAGSLSSALSRFAAQAGIILSYDASLTSGKHSPGLQGRFTPLAGLTHLLHGTGLQAYPQADGSYGIRSVEGAGPMEIAATDISDWRLSDVTENSGSYTTSAMSVATKIPTSLKETPRSVTIFSNQQLKDQGLQNKNLEEVLRYTPGITIDDGITGYSTLNSGTNLPKIYSRGQQVSNFQIDGITYDLSGVNSSAGNTQSYYYNYQASGMLALPDMILYDHVEVLRGPNSVFSGNGTPSATINMVRKRPLKYRQIQIEGNTSSWDSNFSQANYRTTLDITSPLPIFDERIRTRFIISRQDGAASFHDHHKSERDTYYGAIDFDLNENTLIGISYSKENSDSTQLPIASGLPRYHWGADIGLPRRTNITSRQSYVHTDSDTLQVYAKHKFNEQWYLDVNASHLDQSISNNHNILYYPGTVYEDNSGANLALTDPQNKSISQNSFDIRVNGEFRILGRKTSVLTGIDSKKLHGENKFSAYTDPIAPNVLVPIGDITNFDRDSIYNNNTIIGHREIIDNQREIGLYSSIKINITDPINLIITARKAKFRNESIGSLSGTPYAALNGIRSVYSENSGTVSQPITPTYSISYDINNNLTSYFSYSESYQDQSTSRKGSLLDPSDSSSYIIGGKLDPATGKNYELGLNGEFLDGLLNTYAVIYYMKRVDILNNLGYGPYRAGGTTAALGYTACCFDNSGEQESKGIDIGISGEIYPGLQLSAGYTYNKNETKTGFSNVNIADGGSANTKSHTRTPEHLLKFFSTYQLQGSLKDWRIGVGAVIQSSSFSSGSTPEYLGYDENYISPTTGLIGRSVWSDLSYYANGANGNFNPGGTYTLPYNFTQSGYAIWSGMIEWAPTNNLTLTLNGNNLFDRRYYRTIGTSTGGNYYGEPRNFSLTARATF